MRKELTKTRVGKVCNKHPELNGLQFRASYVCVQCSRNASRARRIAKRDAEGKSPRILYTPKEAAERIKARDKIRNKERRESPAFNAAQLERKRLWRTLNRDKYLASCRAYDARQLIDNPQRRISRNLRRRIGKAMLGKTRGVSAVRDLGMSICEFKNYITSMFTEGMTWDNYGKWHLDHIKPLVGFDLTDQNQAKEACHYSNIQPLWAEENQKKGCNPHHETWDGFYRDAWEMVEAQ